MFKDPIFISLYGTVFILLWISACGLISWLSGWYKFAQKYTPESCSEFIEKVNFISIQLNSFGSYNNCMQLAFYKEGIMLKPLFLFKAFHPPLFVPWNKITALKESVEFFWFPILDLYVDGNKIRFYGKAMKKIKAEYSVLKKQF